MKALKIKDVNLYKRFTANPQKKAQASLKFRLAVPIVLLAAVLGGVIFALQSSLDNMQAEYDKQLAIVNKYENSNDADAYSANQTAYDDYTSQLTLYNKIIASYPVCNKELIDKIFSCSIDGITVGNFSYDMKSGTISYSAASSNVNLIPQYITKLRGTGCFSDVTYDGYASDDNAGYKLYSFSVSCVLAEKVPTSDFDEYIAPDDLAIEQGDGIEAYDPNAEKTEEAEAAAK